MPRQSIEISSFSHNNPIPAATRIGPLVVSSIIPPFNAGERKLPDTIEAQIDNLFLHVGNMLDGAGAGWGDVAKMTFYVSDIKYREAVNDPFTARFPDADSRPSRHVQLAAGGGGPMISCDFIAYVE